LLQAYKVEIFDRDINFKDVAAFGGQPIYFDYLTLEKTSIEVPSITAAKGDYAHITDFSGNVVYQGIVADVEITKSTTILKLSPLLSLFDLTVSYDRTDLQNGYLEDFIAGIITDTFISNTDILQNIPGLSATALTHTEAKLNLKSNVHEFYDIITKALTLYGVVVSAVLNPQKNTLAVTVGKCADTVTIEADLKNVVEKTIVFGDSYGSLNKAIFINKDNEAERVTYYLHTDGTVSTINIDRVIPVFLMTEYIEGAEDFELESEARAIEALTPQKYDNLIELTFLSDDKLINPANIQIGTTATIYHDGNAYTSILTGYEKTRVLEKLIFGAVRIDLTKKLILQRRAAND
jgi:hypothetical protein